MPIAALDPLETWLTGTENVRSSGLDQKSLVYSPNDATDPHQTLAIRCCPRTKIRFLDEPHISISSKARKLGSVNLHEIDADQCMNERSLKTTSNSLGSDDHAHVQHLSKGAPPKSKVHGSVRHHMPVRIDALGMGSDENKPCENRP